MLLDYNSLLIALGLSAAGLSVAILGGWLLVRSERFMLTWAIGLMFLLGNVVSYSAYVQDPKIPMASLAMAFLLLGTATLYGAAVEFIRSEPPIAPTLRFAVPSIFLTLVPMALGVDGIGFFAENFCAAVIFFAIAWEYWRGRHEAPVPISGVSLLYALVGVSFVLCAGVIAWDGNLVMPGPPDNWAEDLCLVVALIGMTGIGALSLALNQWRLATRHRQEAMTDSLTGLLNRRALFETYGKGPLAENTVVIVFDLDRFKSINDLHGHAVGDAVLRRFGETLIAHSRPGDSAARLGGEEFALILPATPPGTGGQIADHIRRRFESETFPVVAGFVSCTVSAGLAVPTEAESDFDAVLSAADHALYLAKSAGRNRIVPATRLLAS